MGYSAGRTNKTRSQLHLDPGNNVYALVAGEKEIVLYSPAEMTRCYLRAPVYRVSRHGGIMQYHSTPGSREDG